MNEILVDHEGMSELLKIQRNTVDDIEHALASMPGPVDGGAASALITLLTTGAAEAVSYTARAHHLLTSTATEVLSSLGTTEQQIKDDVRQLESRVG